VPERVGCLASIEEWEMPQLGVFHLRTRGGDRFRLNETHVAPNGLMSGSITRIENGHGEAIDPACRNVLKLVIEQVGESKFPTPILLDDPDWVSYRLAEILPLDMRVKQMLLESDTGDRFDRLREALIQQRLIDPGV
jgi:Lon protease-like protein